jgi:hypothetical protein
MLLQEVLHWLNTSSRRVNRITINMLFVITLEHGTLYLKIKKKEEVVELERKREGKRNKKTTLQINLVLKKEAINGNEL